MVTNGKRFLNDFNLIYNLLSFNVAEDVDPTERGASHVNDPQMRWNQKEVYRLSRNPKQARASEGRKKFLLTLFKRLCFHLHQRHSGEENYQKRRRQNELIEKQFPHNYSLGGAGEGPVEPFVPVEKDRGINQRSHHSVPPNGWLVNFFRWIRLKG